MSQAARAERSRRETVEIPRETMAKVVFGTSPIQCGTCGGKGGYAVTDGGAETCWRCAGSKIEPCDLCGAEGAVEKNEDGVTACADCATQEAGA